MKHYLLTIFLLFSISASQALPVDVESAKEIGQKFASTNFKEMNQTNDLQLVYTGYSHRGDACFYAFNIGQEGFVIVSADDRFRPIVGYSDEGIFETENMSPELQFYLDKIIEARMSPDVVLFDNTAEEWQSVAATGKLISRNRGRGVDYICTTKWNQDSPYNLYAPEASSGPGGRCYAGCVATAMSQVMKRWNHPLQGTGSHSYNAGGWWGPYYPGLYANFGETTYDWEHMPIKLGGNSTQEEIEAVATLMYHCGVSVNMGFAPDGSGANSEDVPYAIETYFSYTDHAHLEYREMYPLSQWQDMLKESFDLGWPIYYSGYSNSGGHAFVCDGYDDNDLFHFNWGWGGSSDGWFVIDEIDYAGWAGAIFNFVPANVYDYMPMQPENFTVESSNDFDFAATLTWTNPTQNIHFDNLTSIDRIVVTRDGKIIYTEDNVAPGANMTFTDHYMPTIVNYGVYAVVNNAQGAIAKEENINLGPTCNWTVDMTSSDSQGWNDGALSFVNSAGKEVAHVSLESSSATRNIQLPFGHVQIIWKSPTQAISQIGFKIKNTTGERKVAFEGASSDLRNGLFFEANNTCTNDDASIEGPKNLTASSSGMDVALSWETPEIDNVINYLVYRDNLLYALASSTSFTDSEAMDVFHSYYVTAFTNKGETIPSNTCNLQPEISCEAPSNLRFEMASPSKVKLSWDAPQAEGLTGYMLYRRAKGEEFKRIKLLTSTTFTDNLTGQPDNHYDYAICAYYSANDCTSGYGSSQEHPELNFVEVNKTIIPQHLDFIIHDNHVILQWQEATMANRYKIYRDGQLIGHSTRTDFIDYTATPQQSYRYTVTGRTDFIESNPSNEVYVDWTTGMQDMCAEDELMLFPNPTSNKIYIEMQAMRQIHVFNVMGQEMLHYTLNGDHANLDLSALPTGSYFIKVTTESSSITKKIMKIQ